MGSSVRLGGLGCEAFACSKSAQEPGGSARPAQWSVWRMVCVEYEVDKWRIVVDAVWLMCGKQMPDDPYWDLRRQPRPAFVPFYGTRTLCLPLLRPEDSFATTCVEIALFAFADMIRWATSNFSFKPLSDRPPTRRHEGEGNELNHEAARR